eukprot:2150846-Pyramimonas_sp.AAC.1
MPKGLWGVECTLAVIGTGGPAPIAEGEREYARSRHQSQKGRENIPVAGANRKRGERIYPDRSFPGDVIGRACVRLSGWAGGLLRRDWLRLCSAGAGDASGRGEAERDRPRLPCRPGAPPIPSTLMPIPSTLMSIPSTLMPIPSTPKEIDPVFLTASRFAGFGLRTPCFGACLCRVLIVWRSDVVCADWLEV